jgi:hypothetical protein
MKVAIHFAATGLGLVLLGALAALWDIVIEGIMMGRPPGFVAGAAVFIMMMGLTIAAIAGAVALIIGRPR